MPESFDPYHKWLGIPPAEQPPHHYRLLCEKQAGFDRLLDNIAAMNTDEAELFATAYAAWNDLMIDGRPPTMARS